MMLQMRITWSDGTTLLIPGTEAQGEVTKAGVIRITRGDRVRYIPPTSYKYVDIESAV